MSNAEYRHILSVVCLKLIGYLFAALLLHHKMVEIFHGEAEPPVAVDAGRADEGLLRGKRRILPIP